MKVLTSSLLFILITSLGLFYGCAQKSEDAAATVTTYKYGGPGSAWDVTLSSASTGTFSVTCKEAAGDETSTLVVSGNYEKLSSGFVKMTVSSGVSSGATNCPTTAPSEGDVAYGLEIPGFTFLLKPLGGDSEIIPMVIQGSCPSENIDMNWITTSYGGSNANDNEADIFGTFSYTASSGQASIPKKYNLANYGEVSGEFSMTGTCSDGFMKMSANGSEAADMYITSLGGALVKTLHSEGGIIVGMPQQEITQSALAGTYTGLLFDENKSSDKVTPIQVTVSDDGSTFTAKDFTNVDTGETSSTIATAVATAVNDPSNGFVKLTLTVDGQTSNMACQAATSVANTTKNMIFCASVHPSATTKLFNVLLVSQ